jgi:hypothetical protein
MDCIETLAVWVPSRNEPLSPAVIQRVLEPRRLRRGPTPGDRDAAREHGFGCAGQLGQCSTRVPRQRHLLHRRAGGLHPAVDVGLEQAQHPERIPHVAHPVGAHQGGQLLRGDHRVDADKPAHEQHRPPGIEHVACTQHGARDRHQVFFAVGVGIQVAHQRRAGLGEL